MRKIILLAVYFASLPLVSHAACTDDVDALAKKYGVTASLPQAKADDSAAVTDKKLAESGGVIAPPATGDMAGLNPSAPDPDRMQTAPAIAPQAANGQTEGMGSSAKSGTASMEHEAAADSQAASLLQAAREAGAKGDETACKQHLADATTLLKKTPVVNQ